MFNTRSLVSCKVLTFYNTAFWLSVCKRYYEEKNVCAHFLVNVEMILIALSLSGIFLLVVYYCMAFTLSCSQGQTNRFL